MRTGEELVQQRAPWQRYLFGQWSVALIITSWLKAPSGNGCRLSCQPQTLRQAARVIILGGLSGLFLELRLDSQMFLSTSARPPSRWVSIRVKNIRRKAVRCAVTLIVRSGSTICQVAFIPLLFSLSFSSHAAAPSLRISGYYLIVFIIRL